MSRIYVETSVISYLTARPSRDLIQTAKQQITREWWENRGSECEPYISEMVVSEVAKGDADAARKRLEFIERIPILPITEGVTELAGKLATLSALPESAVEDAFHIALAAFHGMDVLLTWNCTHIANADMLPSLRFVISEQGFQTPIIFTPHEMLGED